MKTLASTKSSDLRGSSHQLQCCLCGENNRDKLLVEDIGIGIGMSGDDYSFCRDCWNSPDLGKKLLIFLGCSNGLKMLDSALDLKVIP